jgi:ABC-2 type transport system permease protein
MTIVFTSATLTTLPLKYHEVNKFMYLYRNSYAVRVRGLVAQLRIELLLSLRRAESLLITLVVPVVLLVFFGSLAVSPPEFLVPGLLALAVMSTSMVSLGIQTAYERYYGALKRLLGSPLPLISLLAAKALAVLLIELVQVTLLVLIARLAFAWTPAGSWALTAAALTLGSLAFAGLGLLMAGTLRAEATLAAANGLYLAFLLLGGFVLPLERLPETVATVARALPAAALSDAARAALEDSGQGALGPLALLAAWAVVGIGGAALTFRAE